MTLSVETLAEAMSTQRFLRDFNLRTWWGSAAGQPPGTVRLTDEEKEDWRQSATAAFTAIEQAGCVVVPKEPDVQMLAAWYRQKNRGTQVLDATGVHTDDYSAYRAMIAAAPKIQHSEGE